jgi:hypothetical protein
MNGLIRQWLTGSGLKLNAAERATHTHVIGQTGMGKSRMLESWVMQDIVAGRGLAVIDPHGDLYQNLVLRIAMLLAVMPQLAERIILINPNDPVWAVGFNPLQPVNGISLERLAWFLTDVIVKIWKLDTSSMPRMLRLITYSFLTLAEFALSLVDLPRFLFDTGWRQSLIARTAHREVADYFRQEFPSREGAVHQWVTPVLNKIGPLIFDPDVRLMLGTRSTINFRKILDRRLVLLVNLSKGILGEGNSALLGAFFVAHLQQAALSRANSRHRDQYFLYLDEFQNYTTDNIKDILSESRKYGLSLMLAHQYLDQLSIDLRGAVLNTAGTMVCFRLGYHDANLLSREIFPPGYLKASHAELDYARLGRIGIPLFEEKQEPLEHEALTTLLTQLRPREFWTKRRGPYAPIKQRALNMPEPVLSPQLFNARKHLIDTSGQQFGRLKAEIRQEMNHARPNNGDQSTTYYEKI